MKTRLFAPIAAMVACLPLAGWAQEAPPPPPGQGDEKTYSIQLKSVVGDLLKYKTSMTMKMDMKGEKGDLPFPTGGETVISSTIRYKTVAVKPDGTIVQVIETQGGKMKVMGMEMPAPQTPAITLETDKFGRSKPRAATAAGPGGAMAQFMNPSAMSGPGMGVMFPDHPVKVGETWTTELPAPLGDAKIKVTSTLVSAEMVNGKATLKVKQVMVMPFDMSMGLDGAPTKPSADAPMSMKGSANIETVNTVLEENGQTLATTGDIKMEMTMSMGAELAAQSPFGSKMIMKMDGKMTTDLVSAGKVSDEVKPVVKKVPAAKASVKKPTAKQRKQ